MFKKFIILLVLVITVITAKAQTENNIALNVFGAIEAPTGDAFLGLGYGLKAEFPVAPRLKFMFNAGVANNYFGPRLYDYAPTPGPNGVFHEPTGPANNGPYQFVPITVGLRYYYYRHFYIEGEAGEAFKANVTNTTFIYGGTVGGLIRLSKHSALDLNLNYTTGYQFQDYDESTGEVALRLGYRYQF